MRKREKVKAKAKVEALRDPARRVINPAVLTIFKNLIFSIIHNM